PGVPAGQFVLPPALSHGQLFDERTKIKISPADEAILSDMGPEPIRREITSHSSAIFKLLEVVTFLNGRECKYLEERDNARRE
ncbi:hypothetical protein A2U01_0089847, partial [Trifolium medium]|nr:hypothetical protein [Trifolium medium]